jgi:ferrochelatase
LEEGEWSHCYQSRIGPVSWLQPYLRDTLKALAARGIRRLTVVSPSFAVDCLETLQEVAIEYAEEFLKSGGERLSLVPALNDDDRHADFLVSVIRNRLSGWTS